MATEDNLQVTTFEQLATLLTQVAQNNTNLSLTYYNMFYNTTPQDITLKLYNTDGVLQTFTVPNRAKDFNYIKNGSGSPQGAVTANVGTLYQDTLNGVLYIKSVGTDAQGWVEIANNDLIQIGTNNPNGVVTAPKGTLYINSSTSTLYIKSTSTGSDGWIQVNANFSNMANIDLSNISSTAQANIRSAITGGASTITGTNLTTGKALVSDSFGKVAVSDTTDAELEVLHGLTASTTELNKLDGVTATTSELNYVTGATSNIQTQLNAKVETLGNLGVTASASELNTLNGITASTAELNTLDGITASTVELNYMDGVTSNVQTQLDGKVSKSGDTMTGGLTISNLGSGDSSNPFYIKQKNASSYGANTFANITFSDVNDNNIAIIGSSQDTSGNCGLRFLVKNGSSWKDIPYLKDTYINGLSGYRIWSDGYCEQWGIIEANSSERTVTVNFLKTFADYNYNLTSGIVGQNNTNLCTNQCAEIAYSKELSYFNMWISSTTNTIQKNWVARGYLASGQY